jgi:hypothetical protein
VEGERDKQVIEAFLKAGESSRRWANWVSRLDVVIMGGIKSLLDTLEKQASYFGLIDRDWRSESEISALETKFAGRLAILPRVMIDNYFIWPQELALYLRDKGLTETRLNQEIRPYLYDWIQHGALSQTIHERGGHDFCRGTDGYPRVLLRSPVNSAEIRQYLEDFQHQLDPENVLNQTQNRSHQWQQLSDYEQYALCLDGKAFFNQVILKTLNTTLGQSNDKTWLRRLLLSTPDCPADLIPILAPLVTPLN